MSEKDPLTCHLSALELTQRIGQNHFEGNIIPHAWYSHAKFRTERGNLNYPALHLLANLIYWYRPVVERDEYTQAIISVRPKFRGHRLRVDYAAWGEHLGMSKRLVQDVVAFLRQQGLIEMQMLERYEAGPGNIIYNAVFLIPVPDAIAEVSAPRVGGVALQCDTPFPNQPPIAPQRYTPRTVAGGVSHQDGTPPPPECGGYRTTAPAIKEEEIRETGEIKDIKQTTAETPVSVSEAPTAVAAVFAGANNSEEIHECSKRLIAEMLKIGVDQEGAERLVRLYSTEQIEQQIRALPIRSAKDKAKMLVSSIQRNFPLPDAPPVQATKTASVDAPTPVPAPASKPSRPVQAAIRPAPKKVESSKIPDELLGPWQAALVALESHDAINVPAFNTHIKHSCRPVCLGFEEDHWVLTLETDNAFHADYLGKIRPKLDEGSFTGLIAQALLEALGRGGQRCHVAVQLNPRAAQVGAK